MASMADYHASLYIDIYRILREAQTRSLLEIVGLLLKKKQSYLSSIVHSSSTDFKDLKYCVLCHFYVILSGKYLYKKWRYPFTLLYIYIYIYIYVCVS